MALGFDMICAEIVLKLKKVYPSLKLIGALPCKDQANLWNSDQIKRYNNLIKQLKYNGAECMHERNHYMINNSSLIIALFDGKNCGTSKTIDYAIQQGIETEIITP